jgi:hypothetical protein
MATLIQIIASLTGAVSAFVFFTMNDPDALQPGVIQTFQWLILLPVATAFGFLLHSRFWLVAMALLGGIFLGVCVRAITPPHHSNIWPIAGVYWTVRLALPVLLGSSLGGLCRFGLKRMIPDKPL